MRYWCVLLGLGFWAQLLSGAEPRLEKALAQYQQAVDRERDNFRAAVAREKEKLLSAYSEAIKDATRAENLDLAVKLLAEKKALEAGESDTVVATEPAAAPAATQPETVTVAAEPAPAAQPAGTAVKETAVQTVESTAPAAPAAPQPAAEPKPETTSAQPAQAEEKSAAKPMDRSADNEVKLPLKPGLPSAQDGLEQGGEWLREEWGNKGSCNAAVDLARGTRNAVLRLFCEKGSKGRTVFKRFLETNQADSKVVSFAAYNASSDAVSVSLAVVTGKEYLWYEAKPAEVPPGKWSEFRFELGINAWKAASREWKYTGPVENLNEVHLILLIVHNEKGEAEFFIDDLNFGKK